MAITSQVSSQTSNATTITVNLPASVAAGDLLVVLEGSDVGGGAQTNNGGFTELKDETGTDIWCWIGYKIAAGGETSFVITGTSERRNAIAYRIPAAEWHGTTVPEVTAVADGTGTTPDPPSITPSWGSETGTTFIAVSFNDDSTAPTITGWPTNYSLNQVQNGTATSGARVAAAIRIVASSPENPGTFTLSGTEHWRTYTVAVRGAAAGGATLVPARALVTLTTSTPALKLAIAPAAASIPLTTSVPVVTIANTLVPARAPLTLTTSVPVLRTTLAPAAATVALTTSVPKLTTTLVPAAKGLTLTTSAPGLVARIAPAAAGLTITTSVPVLTTSAGGVTLSPARALLTITTSIPVVTGFSTILAPAAAGLTLTTSIPGVTIVPAFTTTGGLGPSVGGVRYGAGAGAVASLHPIASVRNTNP